MTRSLALAALEIRDGELRLDAGSCGDAEGIASWNPLCLKSD